MNEPTFTLTASDPAAAALVRLWVYTRGALNLPIDGNVVDAIDRAQAMESWCKDAGKNAVSSILALLPYDILSKELVRREYNAPPTDNAHVAPGCEQFPDEVMTDTPRTDAAIMYPGGGIAMVRPEFARKLECELAASEAIRERLLRSIRQALEVNHAYRKVLKDRA